MDLKQQFEKASQDVKLLPSQPNEVLLKLYGLYKQATSGDVSGSRPGMIDFKGRSKFDRWAEQKGKSTEDAMKEYIDCVSEISS